MRDKDFRGEFDRVYNLLVGNEGFSFARFSDGERTVMFNKKLVIAENYFIQEDVFGDRKIPAPRPYLPEEHKEFDPKKHSFYSKKLLEAYRFTKNNYLKGICGANEVEYGPCHDIMIKLHGGNHENLTFSNVLQNGNYSSFVEKMIPEFMNHQIILVANENCSVELLPFEIKKFFPIGKNCMINNYGLVDEIKKYIQKENICDHLFLFSAATLSNYLCYELYKDFDNNKYMDIGSTLGPLLGLDGWKNSRSYLLSYWHNIPSPYINQFDTWGKM